MRSLLKRSYVGIYLSGSDVYLYSVSPGIKPDIKTSNWSGNDALENAAEFIKNNCENPIVVIGLPLSKCLFLSKEILPVHRKAVEVAEDVLRPATTGGLEVYKAYKTFNFGKRRFVQVTAVEKDYVDKIANPFNKRKISIVGIEPAAWCVADFSKKIVRPRLLNRKPEIRIFMCDTKILVTVCLRGNVLTWESMGRGADEQKAVVSCIRRLTSFCMYDLKLKEISRILVFSSTRNKDFIDALSSSVGVECIWKRMDLRDDSGMAVLLSQQCAEPEFSRMDVYNFIDKTTAWKAFIPFHRMATLAVMTIVLGILLNIRIFSLQNYIQYLQNAADRKEWASDMDMSLLDEKLNDIKDYYEKIKKIEDSRIGWYPYLVHVASIMPQNTWLRYIEAVNEIFTEEGGVPRRYISLRGSALLRRGGSVSRDVELSLNAIKNSKIIRAQFPDVILSTVSGKKEEDKYLSLFSIDCKARIKNPFLEED